MNLSTLTTFHSKVMAKIAKKPEGPDYENVAAQVLDIVNHDLGNAVSPAVKDRLMQSLIVYIEGYGSVVHRHAYDLGWSHKVEDDKNVQAPKNN